MTQHSQNGEGVEVREYRKTATIKASQWWKMGDHPAVVMASDVTGATPEKPLPFCPTLEGGHIVTPGDWIATGVQGEHWPIKADVFAATYAPVDQPATRHASGPAFMADRTWPDCLDPNAAHNRRQSLTAREPATADAGRENQQLRGALIAMGRMIPGVIVDDRVSSDFLASLPEELAHYALSRAAPSSGHAMAEDASLLADAASWYSDGQIEEMEAKAKELRAKIRQCNEAIENGKFDSWHHRDLHDHKVELRDLEKTLSEARL